MAERQFFDVRSALLKYAAGTFALLTVTLVVRCQILDTPFSSSVMTLLFLSVIGVLPITTPITLWALESIGVGRILSLVEFVLALEEGNENVSFRRRFLLLFRYVIATLRCRLLGGARKQAKTNKNREDTGAVDNVSFDEPIPSLDTPFLLQQLQQKPMNRYFGSKLKLEIPPQSCKLLERLGVVTASSIIDDEIVCKPFSTPQQMLIPSARGLKMLDLSVGPTSNNNESEEGSENSYDPNVTSPRKRVSVASSSSSSSSDSDDEDKVAVDNLGRRIKTSFRRVKQQSRPQGNINPNSRFNKMSRMVKNMAVAAVGMKEEEEDVSFEDPLWWKHLNSVKAIGLASMLVERAERRESVVDQGVEVAENTDLDSNLYSSTPADFLSRSPPRSLTGTIPISSSAPNLHNVDLELGTAFNPTADKNITSPISADSSTELKFSALEHHDSVNCLVSHVTRPATRTHLSILCRSIGFSSSPNSYGPAGDLSFFQERRRLLYVKRKKAVEKFETDAHALGMEEGRSIGYLRPELSSVIVKDGRSNAYQLMTVGDAVSAVECCTEVWQGENSTIGVLGNSDRAKLRSVIDDWSLADLSVSAFAYSPVPYTMESRIDGLAAGIDKQRVFLIDNEATTEGRNDEADDEQKRESGREIERELEHELARGEPPEGDKEGAADADSISAKEDWTLMKNQIFLGLLGSTTTPRKDIAPLINKLEKAGIRFIYFSPRNMRRSKSIAIKMGIDVSFNCAISLRELSREESVDKYRMTSNYADWDVNAQMPHGVTDIKKHLREIDNVPLLVSLFTDATHQTTTEMVGVLKDYGDTVLSVGSSHRLRNERIFKASDLSIGVDLLLEEFMPELRAGESDDIDGMVANDINFASALVCHNCIFNFPSAGSVSKLPDIIGEGRGALNAVVGGCYLCVLIGVTLNLICIWFSVSVAYCTPTLPPAETALVVLLLLPLLAISMGFSEGDEDIMKNCPIKNEKGVVWGGKITRQIEAKHMFCRGAVSSIGPFFVQIVAFGELLGLEERDICGMGASGEWWKAVRCQDLVNYDGDASRGAGILAITNFSLVMIFVSAGILFRDVPAKLAIFKRNYIWSGTAAAATLIVLSFGFISVNGKDKLTYWFWLNFFFWPFVSLKTSEWIKVTEKQLLSRGKMLRRLQFETKLGMHSPVPTLDRREKK